MGHMKQVKLEKRDKRPGGWSPKGEQKGGRADWGKADPLVLCGAITAVASAGGALRFGYTRDGGAYALGVYGDGEPRTVYIKPAEDLNDILRDLQAYFDDLKDTGQSGPAS